MTLALILAGTTNNLSTGMSTIAWVAIAVGALALVVATILLVSYLVGRIGSRRPSREPQAPGHAGRR